MGDPIVMPPSVEINTAAQDGGPSPVLKEFHLHCHDPAHGEAIGLITLSVSAFPNTLLNKYHRLVTDFLKSRRIKTVEGCRSPCSLGAFLASIPQNAQLQQTGAKIRVI